jgi:hypothetical protein
MVAYNNALGNRFPLAAQNSYFNVKAFAYPAAFRAGTLGRNCLCRRRLR